MFKVFRKDQTIFHSGWTVLHSHQKCVKVPIFPHFWQHFGRLFFNLIYLVQVVLICWVFNTQILRGDKIQSITSIYLDFLFLLESLLVIYVFVLCISRNLSIHLSYLICWCTLFMVFSYTTFNFHKVGNKVLTCISDFSYLCLLSFFFVSLPTCLSILLIFSKNPLLVSWILLFFCPLFHWPLEWVVRNISKDDDTWLSPEWNGGKKGQFSTHKEVPGWWGRHSANLEQHGEVRVLISAQGPVAHAAASVHALEQSWGLLTLTAGSIPL